MNHQQGPKGTVRVECKGAAELPLDFLNDFQDGLKEITPEDLVALQREIIDFGFNSPVHVWREKEGNVERFYLLDGHQRTAALRALREEGWTVPHVPVVFVDAEDRALAKRKVLGLAGTYGRASTESVAEYVKLNELDIGSLDTLSFPDVEMDDVLLELAPEPAADEETKTKKVEFEAKVGSKELPRENFEKFAHTCPKCGFGFDE